MLLSLIKTNTSIQGFCCDQPGSFLSPQSLLRISRCVFQLLLLLWEKDGTTGTADVANRYILEKQIEAQGSQRNAGPFSFLRPFGGHKKSLMVNLQGANTESYVKYKWTPYRNSKQG
jgi:hypothetical protein